MVADSRIFGVNRFDGVGVVMRKLQQLIVHDPSKGKYGDCFRTCVAMILGKPCPSEVPHFYKRALKTNDQVFQVDREIKNFLNGYGLRRIVINMDGSMSFSQLMEHSKAAFGDLYFLLTLRRYVGGPNHCVVCQNGKVFADPQYEIQEDYEPCELNLEEISWFIELIVRPLS